MRAMLPDARLGPPLPGANRALIERARELAGRGASAVLGVVVQTTGSTYRKAGALILLDADGVRAGALSGGCLEVDLEERARAVLAGGRALAARFDTRGDEDRVFGSGTGCGGSTNVLLLPLPSNDSPLRDALIEAQAQGHPLMLKLANGSEMEGAGEARIGAAVDGGSVYRFDHRGRAQAGTWLLDAPVTLTIAPPPRVLLMGAGPETRSLLLLTRLLGWHVELVEHRERWAKFAAECGIDHVHDDGPAALPGLLERLRFDAVLVMNHNLDLDARALTRLADTSAAWIGLLGPPARRDTLLAEMGAHVAARLRPRLHAPVGLPLGGEGTEAIALAIAAQLQLEFAQRAQA